MARDTKLHAREHSLRHGASSFMRIILLLMAFALFLYRLDAQSLWYDEAVSARLAGMSVPALVKWTANDIQPPLYYLLLHLWRGVAGQSEWALRYFSAWWGLIIVAIGFVLARRLGDRGWAGYLSMVFFTWVPWLVYYSQETRMYTMLVALSMVWVYVLLAEWKVRRALWLGGLSLVLLYTHYFALFLILALALWEVSTHLLSAYLDKKDVKRALLSRVKFWLSVGGIIFVGYIPWLPFLLRRFRQDASYWKGTLKLGEAARHWAVHMTLGAPETALETAAVHWLPLFAGITFLALVLWLLPTSSRPVSVQHVAGSRLPAWSRMSILLMWLILPILGILILAYRNPKFNPRYLMMAYPAWVLLLATAPTRWSQWISTFRGRNIASVTMLAIFLIPVPLFAQADKAWFTDPAFTKPDFRGAIRYLQAHRTASEALFLVSGHMSPVVDYYAPGMSYVRLPDVDVLDVRRVLDFTVAPRINQAIQGREGVWLLLWQDEVVDPMGIVPYLLRHAAQEDTRVPNAFWHVRVRHFRLRSNARVPLAPPLTHPVQVNFANRVRLLGVEYRGGADVTFFFRAMRPLGEDMRLHMELWDAQGNFWGASDTRPGPYLYPTFRWQPEQIVLGEHPLPFMAGLPTGTYDIRLRLYDRDHPSGWNILDSQGNAQGVNAIVPNLVLSHTLPITENNVDFPPLPPRVSEEETHVWTGFGMSSSDVSVEALRVWPSPPWEPGERVRVQIRWRVRRPHPTVTYELALQQGGKILPWAQDALVDIKPSQQGEDVRFFTQVAGRVPTQTRAGTWQLVLRLTSTHANDTMVQSLGTVDISPSQRNFTLPTVTHPVGADFGGVIRFVGFDMPERWSPGTTLPITVTWQAITEMERSYTVFVHLLGPDGQVVAQEDHIPGRGAYPTDGWLAGEVVQDRFDINVPEGVPLSTLRLEVGVYDAALPGAPRLPVTAGKSTGRDAVVVTVP